jgi:F-type H+-transporting ATPase subunit b
MTTATSVFLLPNGTFFVELAVTIILIVAFSKWLLPPLTKAMSNRQEQIRASLASAEKARQDAEAADDERHVVLEGARSQAREIVSMAQQTADQLRADAATRAQAEYDRIVAAAAADVQVARQRAVDEAAARLGEVVIDVVAKIVGREIDAASHRDLIDEAIVALTEESRKGAGQTR